MSEKISIKMLSISDIVKGQGVSSAFHEQVNLVSKSDKLDICVNKHFKNADITHHHTVGVGSYIRMFNKKTIHVAYVHMLAEKLEGSIKLNSLFYKIFKWYTHSFYRKADYLVIVNPDTKKMLLSYGISEDKIYYIPNYVSSDQFYEVDDNLKLRYKQKYKFKTDRMTILSVGQVLLGKGVEDFIASAKNNPHLDYVWAGGFTFGPLTDGYETLKDYVENPPKNVRFIGLIDRRVINEVYNAADILFMPSFNEMFPMTILEAVNTHTPIVIRNLELYEDILFDYYRPCAGIVDFDDEILKITQDEAYRKQSICNSVKLKDFYDQKYVLKLWEDFYSDILKKKGRNNVK